MTVIATELFSAEISRPRACRRARHRPGAVPRAHAGVAVSRCVWSARRYCSASTIASPTWTLIPLTGPRERNAAAVPARACPRLLRPRHRRWRAVRLRAPGKTFHATASTGDGWLAYWPHARLALPPASFAGHAAAAELARRSQDRPAGIPVEWSILSAGARQSPAIARFESGGRCSEGNGWLLLADETTSAGRLRVARSAGRVARAGRTWRADRKSWTRSSRAANPRASTNDR